MMLLKRLLAGSLSLVVFGFCVPCGAQSIAQTPKLDQAATADTHSESASSINTNSNAESSASLFGKVSNVEVKNIVGSEIDRLMSCAMQQNETVKELDKKIALFRTKKHKVKAYSAEVAYAMVPYRGFGPSKQASQILLDRAKKVTCLPAAEYYKQRIEDDLHTQVVTTVLQLAMALDEQDKTRSAEMKDAALARLSKLVGEEQARTSLDSLVAWGRAVTVSPQAFKQTPWDIESVQQNIHDVTATAVNDDPVMRATVKKVKKYNRSKGMTALGSVVESTAAVGSLLAPGLLIPVAVTFANGHFVASTGGNEETKMINEIYYSKSMESRFRRLNEEAQMALNNYQTAVRTQSPSLLACCEAILSQLVGPDRAGRFLGQTVLAAKDKPMEPLQTAQQPLASSK